MVLYGLDGMALRLLGAPVMGQTPPMPKTLKAVSETAIPPNTRKGLTMEGGAAQSILPSVPPLCDRLIAFLNCSGSYPVAPGPDDEVCSTQLSRTA